MGEYLSEDEEKDDSQSSQQPINNNNHQSKSNNNVSRSEPEDNNDLEEDLFGGEDDEEENENDQDEEEEESEEQRLKKDLEFIENDEEEDGDGGGDDDDLGNQSLTEEEKLRRRELEYEEDLDNQIDPQSVTTKNLQIAEVPLPNLPLPEPSDGKHWDFRLPNFLNLDTNPFDDEKFLNEGNSNSDEAQKDENSNTTTNGNGPAKTHLTDHNVVRWRWVKGEDGKMVKQSNSRVICWSDGSQSLQVGSELFDMVYTLDTRQPSNSNSNRQAQGLTYLFVRHFGPAFSEAQASINGQITLRPYGLNSLTHRTLVASRGLNKSQRQTRVMVVTVDPDKQKFDNDLEEAKKLKDLKKLEAKLARQQNRQANLNESGGPREKGVRKRRFNAPLLSDEGEAELGLGNDYEDEYEELGDDEDEEMEDEDQDVERGEGGGNDRELSELELADQRLELEQRNKRALKDQSLTRNPSGIGTGGENNQSSKVDEPKVIRRKLIIASDDDE